MATLEAWFCPNCSRPVLGDRCIPCGYQLPSVIDDDDDDADDDGTDIYCPDTGGSD